MAKPIPKLSPEQIKAIVATAWDDLPPYHKVQLEHAIGPGELTALMKRELSSTAYKMWAARAKVAKKPTAKGTFPYGR
ncbi:MAG TPA: DUF2805 domain-containing protein [Burkholderiaceae bacterium]